MREWVLYGANGYTGELIARQAASEGLRPILAGRDATAIGRLAGELGLEARVFGLDDPAALARGIAGAALVLHAAGPFSRTSAPMVAACLESKIHYLDITGEIPVFEACRAQGARARERGVVLMPGVGFDVVPSDCLAKSLAEALPGRRGSSWRSWRSASSAVAPPKR
ncbi:saccharopine dehydrogenase NADP-binding domain-containing protein [Nannocystis pusilla]|uniref:saccharopine dehydrogenase NADP-binding domain-containing protein n=1 Tax=Nannocystis pusilla TaxID=889268 RepID=UPI003B77FC90